MCHYSKRPVFFTKTIRKSNLKVGNEAILVFDFYTMNIHSSIENSISKGKLIYKVTKDY